jgi:hypothetical protein
VTEEEFRAYRIGYRDGYQDATRPEGVTLRPEEVARVLGWYNNHYPDDAIDKALLARFRQR